LGNADEPLINPTGLDHPESRQNLTLHQDLLSSSVNHFSGWALSVDDVPEGSDKLLSIEAPARGQGERLGNCGIAKPNC